jgi:CubicO group peptidase (beta-lactamase class C family)
MKKKLHLKFVFSAFLLMVALGGTKSVSVVRLNGGSDAFDAARRKIGQILNETAASGVAVAVAKDGKIVWEQGFGFTAHDGKTPVTPDTMFSLASITKALTATGLMVLVERGVIDLDKPANDYLGEGKLTAYVEGSPAATIKNLIYHTAGLPMHYHLFYGDKPQRAPGMDESIRSYGILTSPPGEAYRYSNFGYGVLGHIIARASGKTYAAFMKQDVFDPLAMTRTMILTEPTNLDSVAVKYGDGKKELPMCDFDHQGASAAYASVHDLVRFGMFHLGDNVQGQKRILKNETLAAMHRESGGEFMDGDIAVKYLLGSFGQIDHLGYRFQVVTGGMPGAVSRLDIIPSERIISAVLANSDDVDLWALQHEIFAAFLRAFRDTSYKPPKAAETDAKEKFSPPDSLLGRWSGAVRTFQKNLPAALTFMKGSDVILEIDGKKYYPLSVKTELGDMSFKDGIFSGLFWGRIDTPDTAGLPHAVYMNVKLRQNRLTGSAAAVSIDARKTFFLPHWIELAKPDR